MVDRGLVEIGRFKDVVENWGKAVDRVHMQKDVEVEPVKAASRLDRRSNGKG